MSELKTDRRGATAQEVIRGKGVVKGMVEGEALVFREAFSFLGDVDMDIGVLVKISVEIEFPDPAPGIGKGCLGGFLHDLSEFAGQNKLSGPLNDRYFDGKHVSARFCPGQSRGHSNFGRNLFFPVLILRLSQEFLCQP